MSLHWSSSALKNFVWHFFGMAVCHVGVLFSSPKVCFLHNVGGSWWPRRGLSCEHLRFRVQISRAFEVLPRSQALWCEHFGEVRKDWLWLLMLNEFESWLMLLGIMALHSGNDAIYQAWRLSSSRRRARALLRFGVGICNSGAIVLLKRPLSRVKRCQETLWV